jgi:dihydrodipicolinate synthase/N-acetylneuraminate lyase
MSPAMPPTRVPTPWWPPRRIICRRPSRKLREYLDHLVPELPLPLYPLQHAALTKVSFELETVRHAMDLPRIIGLKDSSGNLDYFKRAAGLLQHRPDWTLLIGPEEMLLESIAAGGLGGVSGGANLFPKLYVKLVQAARAGDVARARELQTQVLRVSHSLYHMWPPFVVHHQGHQMRAGLPRGLQ